jgi:hypothetical protein
MFQFFPALTLVIQSFSIILYIVLTHGTAAVEYNFQNIWQNFIPDSYSAKVLPMSTLFNKINFLGTWSAHSICLTVTIPCSSVDMRNVCVGCDPWASWHCIFLCLGTWLDIPSTCNSDSLFPLSTVKEDTITGEKTAEVKALKNCNYVTSHLYFNKHIKFSS